MRADEGDLARAVEKTWPLLLASNRTPWLFRYAGIPTWVVPDDEGRPVAATLTEDRLRHMLARLARWVRENAKGELTPAPPPVAVVKSVLATPDPGLPVLMGIVNTPVFGRNGKLLTSPGYHPDARLLYQPASGFTVPAIPERPTAQQIAEARALICEDLLGDFPFVGAAGDGPCRGAAAPRLRALDDRRADAVASDREAHARHRRHADGGLDHHHSHRYRRQRHDGGP